MSGKVQQLRQFWKISERGLTRAESRIFIMGIDPCQENIKLLAVK